MQSLWNKIKVTMNSFFNENGYLNLDEMVLSTESFQKIMDDGLVTDEEILEQTQLVTDLFHQLERTCNQEQIDLIKRTFYELGVLFSVYNYKELN